MEYRNYMEELVLESAEEVLAKYKDVCKCQRCKLDIIALTLNNLPAKYVVTDIGRAHAKLESAKVQFQTDITKELVKSIEKISKNPRH